MAQLEGNGAQRLLQLLGPKGQLTALTLATVVSPSPISIQVDGDTETTPSEGIIMAEHLTEHTRTISLQGGTVNGSTSDGTLSSLTVTDAKMTFKNDLKVGDRLIVAITNDGQLIYVLDKAVI